MLLLDRFSGRMEILVALELRVPGPCIMNHDHRYFEDGNLPCIHWRHWRRYFGIFFIVP